MTRILLRLPDDLQSTIEGLVRSDRHVLARLLLSGATRSLMDASGRQSVSDVRRDMQRAKDHWRAIMDLGCFDQKIVRLSRVHHDAWFQTLEDPYDMRCDMWKLMVEFEHDFSPILYLVSQKTKTTLNSVSPVRV